MIMTNFNNNNNNNIKSEELISSSDFTMCIKYAFDETLTKNMIFL